MASKSALITGGASGLGKHLALALHAQGAVIVIADINVELGTAFAEELNGTRADSAFFKQVDVTDWDQQVELFKYVIEHVDRLDYVFANAGILESTFLGSTSSSTFEYKKPDMSTVTINLHGVLYSSTLAAQVFRTQPLVNGFRGKIVATASVASFLAIPHMPLYSASKHGLIGFVRSFASQLEPEGITVNAVCPNITRSGLTSPDVFDAVEGQGRLTPNDVVTGAFLSFLGDNKSTGQAVEVSMDKVRTRPPPEVFDEIVQANVDGLSEVHKAAYAPAAVPVPE